MRVVPEPAPAVWGVGRLTIGGEVVAWPVSEADIADESAAAADHLATLGVDEGDVVIIVALLSEAIHTYPIEQAAGLRKAVYSCTDATAFDAFRTAALTRQLSPAAVVGVSSTLLDGLAEHGHDLAEVFGPVPAVATTDEGAYVRLEAVGLAPRRWLRLGPTNAFECVARDGAHYDDRRWLVERDGGGLTVTNLAPRLTPARRLPIEVRGEVVENACDCGRPGPRVRVRVRARA